MKQLILRSLIVSFALALTCGCTHPLRITSSPRTTRWDVELNSDVALGFAPTEDDLVHAVIEEVRYNPCVKSVRRNCRPGSRHSKSVEQICSLERTMTAVASGENFAITFPGFFVFAHSWLGYRYHIELETESTIMSPEGDVLSRTSISAPYDIRYTSFLRGAVASTGWYTPGYGILTTIPGAIFASTYDQKATSEFLRQAEPSYKRFVSQRLMEQIRMVRDDRVDSIGRIQTADPVALAMGDSEVDLGYGPRHYAITVARMDGSLAMPMREDVVQLSPEDAALMKRLWEGKESIGIANIRQLMDALSLSDIPVPEDDQQIAAYTMKGETYVALTPEKTGSSGALAALVPDAR